MHGSPEPHMVQDESKIVISTKNFSEKASEVFQGGAMHHAGCMAALNLTWFRTSPKLLFRRRIFLERPQRCSKEAPCTTQDAWQP